MIITNNEELLRVKCDEVLPEEVGVLIETLEKELDYANRLGKAGIGLAAPQIGIAKKISIVRLGNVKFDLINAKIEKGFDSTLFQEEGCLSFPGRVEDTIRFQEVYITDNLISPNRFVATGLLAVVCQHEIDHTNSTLFMDRIPPKSETKANVVAVKVGPNDPCPCGAINEATGKIKKFKKCCSR
jgi:peptide deformylase